MMKKIDQTAGAGVVAWFVVSSPTLTAEQIATSLGEVADEANDKGAMNPYGPPDRHPFTTVAYKFSEGTFEERVATLASFCAKKASVFSELRSSAQVEIFLSYKAEGPGGWTMAPESLKSLADLGYRVTISIS